MADRPTPQPDKNWNAILKWSLAQTDENAGAEPARQISEEEKKWFTEAVASGVVDEIKRMKDITAVLSTRASEVLDAEELDARCELLEELIDRVGSIDNGGDLHTIGGLAPLVETMKGSPHARLRAASAEALGVTVQNHAKAQADALACGAMAPLLAMAAGKDGGDAPCSDADLAETVGGDEETARARTRASFQLTRAKALYALSCLLRGCVAAQKAFALGDGFAILRACLLVDSAKIRTKVLHLARHLCQLDMIFMRAGVESGYVLAAAAALSGSLPRDFGAVADVALREDAERANVELAQVREAALRFIVDCAKKVDFEEVPKAVDHLRGTHVENALRSVRAAHEGMSAEDASACADEIALRVELERMLEG